MNDQISPKEVESIAQFHQITRSARPFGIQRIPTEHGSILAVYLDDDPNKVPFAILNNEALITLISGNPAPIQEHPQAYELEVPQRRPRLDKSRSKPQPQQPVVPVAARPAMVERPPADDPTTEPWYMMPKYDEDPED